MAAALAAKRATDVLRYLARHPDETLTLSELAERLTIARPALHGVLIALSEAGFVERSDDCKRYRLGPEAVVLGSAARAQNSLLARAAVVVAEFVVDHGCPTTIVARRGAELVVLDGTGPRVSCSDLSWPGRQIPMVAPTGAGFMAFAPHQEVLAWFERSRIEPTSDRAEALRDQLALVRERRWVRAQAGDPGIHAVLAAPLLDGTEPPTLALVCTVVDPIAESEVEALGERLAGAASQVVGDDPELAG